MNEISQVINEIVELYERNSDNLNLGEYFSELNNAEEKACDFSELIAIKYNKCILLDKFFESSENEFRKSLEELNSLLLSSVIDDGDAGDEFYFNVAKLNFKVHNYETANLLLDKSIAREKGNVNSSNMSLRYDKRCLKGYCLEYIALAQVKQQTLSGCGAVKGLLPIGRLNKFYRDVFIFFTGKSIEDFSNRSDEIIPLTVRLYKFKKEGLNNNIVAIEKALMDINATNGFLYEIINLYNPVLIQLGQVETYNKYIKEIAHILAHCLSEYCKAMPLVPLNQREGRTNLIYFSRLSDFLMKELGNDFAPCYATLKIEKKEYFLAIEQMFKAKGKIREKINQLQPNSDEYFKQERELAQLNFYIWYFSFITKIKVDQQCKNEFFEYGKLRKDSVAVTYYCIFNFKEMLTKIFTSMKYDMLTSEDVEKLKICKKTFDENKPNKTFPTEIIDECKMLSLAYDAFMLSYKIIESGYTDLVSLYMLQKKMSYGATFSPTIEKSRIDESVRQGVWRVFVGPASFAYRGFIVNLKTTLNCIGTHLSKKPKLYDDAQTLFQDYESANILIFIRDDTFDDDIEFIANIVEYDRKLNNPTEHHNIFVDLSGITDKTKIENFKTSVLKRFTNVECFTAREISVMQCIMFSMLEVCWNRLNDPLEAYVISPVESSESYSYQDCSILAPLSYDKFLAFKSSSVFSRMGNVFKNDFIACYSGERMQHRRPKQLQKEYLSGLNVRNRIKHIVYLETTNDESIIYSFNFHDERCISDGIVINDNKNGTNEIMSALDSIYRQYREQKRHNHLECNEICGSICRSIDINTDNTYKALREYLYSYVGVMLDEYIYVLLRSETNRLNKTDYMLCIFDGEIAIDQTICHQLRRIPNFLVDYNEVFCQDAASPIAVEESAIAITSINDAITNVVKWVQSHHKTDDTKQINDFKNTFDNFCKGVNLTKMQEQNLNIAVRPFLNRLFKNYGTEKFDDTYEEKFNEHLIFVCRQFLNNTIIKE